MTTTSSRPDMRAHAIVCLVATGIAVSACRPVTKLLYGERALYADTDSMGTPVVLVREVSSRARAPLVEGSAAAMSARQPGVMFTLNDSGHDPYLFAIDTLGADRGAWRVTNAKNVDWESLSPASCGAMESARDPAREEHPVSGDESCLFIGDTGDNSEKRGTRAIYRVREPLAGDAGLTGVVASDRLVYRYSQGPRDVEAIYVSPNGAIRLVTKRPLRNALKQRRPSLVFSIDAPAWNRGDTLVATLVDSLPIVPGSAPLRVVTDASLAGDGRHLAVRTYAQLYIFATDSATGLIKHEVPPAVCNIATLGEESGEGVSWLPSSARLVLTGEGVRSPLALIECPMPRE